MRQCLDVTSTAVTFQVYYMYIDIRIRLYGAANSIIITIEDLGGRTC